jgi:capsular polysaccharide biosynthesis protein
VRHAGPCRTTRSAGHPDSSHAFRTAEDRELCFGAMRSTLSKALSRARPIARLAVRVLRIGTKDLRFRGSLIRRGGVLLSAAHAVTAGLATREHPIVDVVVLGDERAAQRLRRLPRVRVHLLASRASGTASQVTDIDEIHRALRLVPRLGMLVDGLGGAEQERRLRQLLYYVRPHGRYVILRTDPTAARLIAELDRVRHEPGFSADEGRIGVAHRELEGPAATRRLAAAVLDQRRVGGSVVLHTHLNHLLKVRESDMTTEFVRARMQDWTSEQVVAPSSTVTELAPLTLNRADLRWKLPTSYDLPPMVFRTYTDVSCAPRQIVYRDNLLLPDAMRLNRRPYPEQIFTRNVDLRFVRLPRPYGELPVLKGSYYYLDDEHPTVYGHLLTDMSGRLWGWDRAVQEDPDVKLLVSTPTEKETELPGWMQDLLEIYGIPRDRLQVLNTPARVERLYGVTPQFVNFFFGYAAPAIREVWDRWRDRVLAMRPVPETPPRVFVSRPPGGTRECRNAAEVERFFVDAGFDVIRPAEHDLHTQVALFANAERLAGFGGSAMLNAIFRGRDRRLLVMQPESHHAINEYLISSVHGDPVTQHYSPAELAGKPAGNALYQSPFTVDLAGDGELLREFASS